MIIKFQERRKMNNAKNKNNLQTFWKFVKIKFQEVNKKDKKVIITPICRVALQVGNKFYLSANRRIRPNKKNKLIILKTYNYIPQETPADLIRKYIEHQRDRQIK